MILFYKCLVILISNMTKYAIACFSKLYGLICLLMQKIIFTRRKEEVGRVVHVWRGRDRFLLYITSMRKKIYFLLQLHLKKSFKV